jgi:ABC-type nitrate/sulfonate/bicarbonate transport system permease component
MNIIIHPDKKYIFFLSCFLIVGIIIFEFILPPNHFLPRPSIVVLSVISLFRDYQLLVNMFSSISAIYFSSIFAGLFIWIVRRYLFMNKNLFGFLAISLKWIARIVPGILLGLFLILWFPNSEGSKYILIFFLCFTYLFQKAENELKKVNHEFIDAAVSLGAGKNFIFEKVSWKVIEPALVESMTELHFYLWSILIIFEFINGGSGLGAVLRSAILYKDLSALFTSVIIICIIILIGAALIKYFKKKFIFWSIG